MLAVQDFRHASQRDEETVADFIHGLERHFRVAYGRDGLGSETRNALLHSQLQEGLKLELMRALAVSGAESYPALCLAAKNEERCLAEIKKRQQYRKSSSNQPWNPDSSSQTSRKKSDRRPPFNQYSKNKSGKLTCYNCNEPGHFAHDYKKPRTESKGRTVPRPAYNTRSSSSPGTKQVISNALPREDPLDYLLSGSEDEEVVRKVELKDEGSVSKCVIVLLQGVPATGFIDSGADYDNGWRAV